MHIDGRFFFGAFLDTAVVKDIGIGGMFNMALGLQYGIPGGDPWDSAQNQWAGELLYRLALNDVPLQPAFMLRVGYGSTKCTIDTEHDLAISAGYSYPYAALDIYLMLYKPILRFNVSGGYLFIVSPSEDLKGDGSGFTVRAGLDVDLFDNLHIGLGWEMFQFTINTTASSAASAGTSNKTCETVDVNGGGPPLYLLHGPEPGQLPARVAAVFLLYVRHGLGQR